MDNRHLEFHLIMLREAEKACLMSYGIMEYWIPKSQIKEGPKDINEALTRIVIPEWLEMMGDGQNGNRC